MPSTPPRNWTYWLPMVVSLALLAVAAKRIKTYVTAQDPYWYIGLAQSILGGRSDPAELAHGLSYVSPGFPLLLAGCIKVFGVYAPYWLNPLLAVGFLLVYGELVRRLFPSRQGLLIFLPGTLLILIAGYHLNIHFLLYPFRGMPIYVLVMLGFLLLHARAAATDRPLHYVAAGVPFALAVAIREPAVFAAGGAALWILVSGGFRAPASWKRLAWFSLPLVLGLVVVAGVVLAQGRALNNQLASWLSIVSGRQGGHVFATSSAMAGYLVDSLRIPGLLLGIAGVWACRRNQAALCFFLVPAIVFFAFYSLYLAHYRYFLTVLFFLCPLVCAGTTLLVDAAHDRAPRLRPAWVLSVLLVVACAITVRGMDPWGRKVNRRQIEAFRTTLGEYAPEGGVAYVDPTCRYLVDALVGYSHLAVRNPMEVRAELRSGRRCFLFTPLDEKGYYEGYLDRTLDPLGLPPERILPFYAQVEQIMTPEGLPLVIRIANGHFAVQDVMAWDQQVVRQHFLLEGSQHHVIWLDFGEHPPGTVAEAHLEDGGGAVVARWPSLPARHIQGLHAPVSTTGTGWRILEVRSDSSLPPKVLRGVIADDQYMKFSLENQRSLSTHYWLQPPFDPPQSGDFFAAPLNPAGRIVLPVPVGSEAMPIEVRLSLTVPPGRDGQQLMVTGPDRVTTSWPADDGRSYAGLTLTPPHTHRTIAADVRLTAEPGPPAARVSSVAIRVGNADRVN